MSLRAYIPSLPPLLFALIVVSVVSSKSLHLLQHVQSLPLLYFVLYSPTLILNDFLVIVLSRVLLVSPETRLRWIVCILGAFIAYVLPTILTVIMAITDLRMCASLDS